MKRLLTNPEKSQLAFETVALPLMDQLYSTALRLTKDRYDAEDLVQDCYSKAWGSFESYKSGTSFRSWIFRIMMNTYINQYNRKKRAPFSGNYEVATAVYTENKSDVVQVFSKSDYFHIFDDDICHAFDLLPEQFRIVVHMADVNGMTYQEISDGLDIPPGTVMSRLCRGRKLMLRYLSHTQAYRHRASWAA